MNDRSFNKRNKNFLFLLLPIVAISLWAQSNEDAIQGIRAPEHSETFRILTESEAHAHHTTLRDQIKEKLSESRLEKEQIDLIADAFSKVMSGVPLGTFQMTEVAEQTDLETDEHTGKFGVLESGYVENLETGSKTHFADASTPFYIEHTLPFDFKRSRITAQSQSEVTFRFVTDTDLKIENAPSELVDALVVQKKMRWAMELTIDKDNRTLKRASFYLDRPIRRRFLYKLDTFRTTFDFEFIEECNCVGVSESSFEVSGSALFVGRITYRATETYSDVECEAPIRYLLPIGHSFEGSEIRY
ncbi:MAG: hypothetical protein OXH31_04710 [Gammaproteobacteria bacterium]|nr:hypothetical protein [Gammaproteobacteria bacterium]